MFTSKTIVTLLAFVLFVNALPVHHGRRGACRPHTSVTPAVPAPTSNVNVGGNVPPVKGGDNTTVKNVPTSTVKESTLKPTKPVSSDAPTKTPGASKPGNTNLAALFPVDGYSDFWSTSPLVKDPHPLSDATFRPTHDMKQLPHVYTTAPDGVASLKAHYPKGSYSLTRTPLGGLSFYAPGPSNVDLTTALEATFAYSVYVPEGFDFQLGGKLPGLYGGDNEDVAVGCSGGSREARCFSARLMFRPKGDGELYTYLPPFTDPRFAANKKQCDAPNSDCNPTYGASIGRGLFKFPTGQRTTVAQRVRLNTAPTKADGQIELFVNGQSVISLSGLILRDSAAGRIRGIQWQTFFGGSSTPAFGSPKPQDLFFSDVSVAITKKL